MAGVQSVAYRPTYAPPAAPSINAAHKPCELAAAFMDRSAAHAHFAAGEDIFSPGEPASFVYRISEGAVITYRLYADGRRQVTAAYPVEERYGLIFAYLGPLDRKPLLPRYNVLEDLEPGEFVEADDSSIGSGGPTIVPCNWLQHFENVMDPFHVPILHGSFSGVQFNERMGLMPKVRFEDTMRGIRSLQVRDLGEGRVHRRITEAVLPAVRAVASPRATVDGPCSLLGWVLPIDDTSFRIYSAGRVSKAGTLKTIRSHFNGKLWQELTEAEHRDFPGDYEAQVSQGDITAHSEEHLVTSDRGIGMLRRLYREQIRIVEAGGNPMGTAFDPFGELVTLDAGTAVVEAVDA